MVLGRTSDWKTSVTANDPFCKQSIAVNPTVSYEVKRFLTWEALLLDELRYGEWIRLLDPDLTYRCSGRKDEERSYLFKIASLRRQPTETPAAEAVCTHRIVSNVIVAYGECVNEFAVSSCVQVLYSTSPDCEMKMFAAARLDRLRRNLDSFRILQRRIRMGYLAPEARELIGPL